MGKCGIDAENKKYRYYNWVRVGLRFLEYKEITVNILVLLKVSLIKFR